MEMLGDMEEEDNDEVGAVLLWLILDGRLLLLLLPPVIGVFGVGDVGESLLFST